MTFDPELSGESSLRLTPGQRSYVKIVRGERGPGNEANIYPRKTPRARAQNKRQTARPRNFFHEIAKITTFTKILPLEKYPLYGMFLYNRSGHCPPHLRMRHVLRNSKYPNCTEISSSISDIFGPW